MKIELRVVDGAVQVSVDGARGKTCEELTKELEAALGHANKRSFKPEYAQIVGRASQRIRQ